MDGPLPPKAALDTVHVLSTVLGGVPHPGTYTPTNDEEAAVLFQYPQPAQAAGHGADKAEGARVTMHFVILS